MTSLVFVTGILFCFHFVSYPCEGKITIKSDTIFFAPGENVVVQWNITNPIADLLDRIWIFAKTGEIIARIKDDGVVTIPGSSFPGVKVTKPSTLILENVNVNYNGTYSFEYTAVTVNDRRNISYVKVIMADKPNLTVCDSPIRVNTSKDVSCLCEGKGGNPPADVTWYNDKGDKDGVTEKEKNTLTLLNVDKTASGTYKCVAKSHTLKDEKSVKVIVNFPPTDVRVTFSPESVFPGDSLDITCEASGEPEPSFTIVINKTQIFRNTKMYTLKNLNIGQKGLPIKCIARNILGMDSSDTKSIPLRATRTTNAPHAKNSATGPSATRTTNAPNTKNSVTGPSEKAVCKNTNNGTNWYIFLLLLVSGVIVGVILSLVVWYFQRRFRSRNPQSNPEPEPCKANSIYQELDLSRLSSEDNYQTLQRVNFATNDADYENQNDPTYTELNKVSDDGNNYQSLTKV